MLAAVLLALTVVNAGPAIADMAEQQYCVSEAIYHEAANEPELGQALVYFSIRNRAKDRHWKPNTPCGIVWQPLQYSFTLWSNYKMQKHREQNPANYNKIRKFTTEIWDQADPIGFEGVNHYLRCDIRHKVKWEDNMEFLGQVGAHCFYRGY